jgi:hypothetical protein
MSPTSQSGSEFENVKDWNEQLQDAALSLAEYVDDLEEMYESEELPEPGKKLSDEQQTLLLQKQTEILAELATLTKTISKLREALGKL